MSRPFRLGPFRLGPFRLGIVVGVRAEARVASPLGGSVAIGGGLPRGAEQAAARLIAEGATALLSFGLAGGLDPALAPGAIVVPERVVAEDGEWRVDAGLAAWLGGATAGAMLAATGVLADPEAKAAAWRRTGAAAVDLESGAVARAAGRNGIPFAVLRAVCDPAGRALPPAAAVALASGGRIDLVRVLASVLAQPGQIGLLIRLGRDAAAARRALAERVRSAGQIAAG